MVESIRESIAWCADAANHEIQISLEDRTAQKLSTTTFNRALSCARRCGFVKLKGALAADDLSHADTTLGDLLRSNPQSPLLATLRASSPFLENDPSVAAATDIPIAADDPVPAWLPQAFRSRRPRPWELESGRAMLDIPFALPSLRPLANATMVVPLVAALLGHGTTSAPPSLGLTIEQAAMILVGPRTGPQQLHSDAAHFSLVEAASAEVAARARASTSPKRSSVADFGLIPIKAYHTSEVQAAFARLRPAMERGEATYALNAQMPLNRDVTMSDGPTALCPASHSELFCRTFLRGICPTSAAAKADASTTIQSRKPGGSSSTPPADVVVAAMRDFVLHTGLCSDDSRIIHWGSANSALTYRSVVSFTYAHEWYTEVGRDLSVAAIEEAVRWRDAWRSDSSVYTTTSARLRDIHTRMREMRDTAERRQLFRIGAGLCVGGYLLVTSWLQPRMAAAREGRNQAAAA